MTTKELRDAFAALAFIRAECGDHNVYDIAETCYDMADAMIFESELREMEYEADKELCNKEVSASSIRNGAAAPVPVESRDASFEDD